MVASGRKGLIRKMPIYLVESYLANADGAVAQAQVCARRAGALGSSVRYVRTTFLPGDETVLHVFEAVSSDAVRDAARVAALPYERIVEAVEGSAGIPAERSRDGR